MAQLSGAKRDLARDGFVPRTRDAEERCEADQVSVLVALEEITQRVEEATRGRDERAANKARKQTLTQLGQQSEDASAGRSSGKLSCESVSLYDGDQYFLYKYKRYSDVRLAFAPEGAIAHFGGDLDSRGGADARVVRTLR